MRDQEIKDVIFEINPEALFANGLEEALIGYVERFGLPPLALYDRAKCIQSFVKQGMTEDEAEEFFEFNTIGAWMGENTPAFATIIKETKP